jgi:hypothetical protein
MKRSINWLFVFIPSMLLDFFEPFELAFLHAVETGDLA